MEIYTASKARDNIFKLIDYVSQSHEPVYITSKRSTAVIISEEDYRALVETLYLTAIPGVKDSLLEEKKLPLEAFSEDLDW